ncbi:hypothetical protein ZWY2020_016551 [Hordeum vulgare]|nr:hypothetical protein ZWY2020_016551 [Hordeum vulgare]
MSSLMSCHCQAAGRNIGTTGGGPTTNCIAALGCAPPPLGKPDSDLLCRVYCYQRGYNLLKSYCKPDGGGTCCCVKP